MLAPVLSQLTALNQFLLTTPVHPSLFPYPILPCIHAARVSLAYRGITENVARGVAAAAPGTPVKRQNWQADVAGFLVMAWGGSLLTAFTVSLIPMQLLSFGPLINYLGIHLLLTYLVPLSLHPTNKLLDTILPLMDGATRAHAVIIGLSLPSHPALAHFGSPVQSSAALRILLGTVAACGGGQLAGTLGVFRPDAWSLSSPPVLKARSVVEAVDVLAPLTASIAHELLASNLPAWKPLQIALLHAGNAKRAGPVLSPAGAKAVVTLIIGAWFAWKALVVHWVAAPATAPLKPVKQISNGKGKK